MWLTLHELLALRWPEEIKKECWQLKRLLDRCHVTDQLAARLGAAFARRVSDWRIDCFMSCLACTKRPSDIVFGTNVCHAMRVLFAELTGGCCSTNL